MAPVFAYVGCRTTRERNARGKGIGVYAVDPSSGSWERVESFEPLENPSFLALNEAQDVLYGVNAAVRRYLWIDRERMGIEGVSYGGQLTDWLITQTNEFKAAIPTAGIANLVSYNYMTYYNQYEEMEFGQFLHQGNLMDIAWERSALKHIAAAHTPTLIIHGENDNDVPIAEAEQLFVALKDVGVETVFLRYPREGHGLSEVKHQIDATDRSIAWYERHFPKHGEEGVTNVQP